MDKELMKKLATQAYNRLKSCEVEVDEKYKTARRIHYYPKKCFEKALTYIYDLTDVEGVKLVHGLYSPDFGIIAMHAWVELPGDIVFDGVMQRFYQKDEYYRIYRAEKISEYTRLEAAQNVMKYNTYGDWGWVLTKAQNNAERIGFTS